MTKTKPTYNLTKDNWVTKVSRDMLNKINAQSVLDKAHLIEKEKIESGTHHFITFIDHAGKQARKLVKIEKNKLKK